MKKKLLIFSVLFIIGLSSLAASFGYQFDLVSLDPLYKEYFADRKRPDTSINYLFYSEGFPDKVLQDVEDGTAVKVWDFNKDENENKMFELKVGETIGLARNTFTFNSWLSPVALDLSIQGEIQTFYTAGVNESYGFDGIYFFGGNLRIADVFSMRVGYHHYCSHYGDEVYKKTNNVTVESQEISFGYKYIRMNDFVLGLSIEPTSWLRVYGEYLVPPQNFIVYHPDMFTPNWIYSTKHSNDNRGYPNSYNDRIVATGIELTFPLFKDKGNTTIGYDLHLYEEGKVIYDHENGGAVTFDEDAPWEMEHNIRIAQDLSKTISVEVTYHNGRSPFNNFFFQHTEYISVSFRFNPDDTVTVVNTKTKE